jgi:glycosyltransferase involved in cell wall biosynthesis
MENMKVLHIISSLSTGGAERMLVKIIEETNENVQHIVIVLRDTSVQGKILNEIGINVRALDISSFLDVITTLWKFKRSVKEITPDIIQGWMYHGNIYAAFGKIFLKKCCLIFNIRHSMHNLKVEKLSTQFVIKINALLSHYANAIIYNSYTSMKQHQEIGYCFNRTVVIPNGFNHREYYKCNEGIKVFLDKYSLPHGKFIFGKVGRDHPMKNHIGFLEAASKIIVDLDKVHFVIVGKGVTVNKQLKLFITNNGLQKSVTLIEERSDIFVLMNVFDCLVVNSSWGEAFPNVLGEAMLCQKPCIVTDIGDCKYIVGDTGITIPPNDLNSLINALRMIASMNIHELENLGIMARKRILVNYSLENIAQNYIDLYSSSITQSK